jgi:hypothetical protein
VLAGEVVGVGATVVVVGVVEAVAALTLVIAVVDAFVGRPALVFG